VDYLPISARERNDVEDVADIIYVAGKSPLGGRSSLFNCVVASRRHGLGENVADLMGSVDVER